jgi:outer membrane protein
MKTAIVTLFLIAGALAVSAQASDDAVRGKLVLGLDDCIRLALKAAPELGEAQADIDQASSKFQEAASYRYPQLDVISLFGPAPEAHSQDISPIVETDRKYSRFNQLTWFSSTNATLIQPLYTFGKISENMKAATHGIEVDRSRKQQRGNEVVLKVREYYYGLMLAREMKELVLEVQETLTKARNTANKLLQDGSGSVEEMDIYKLDSFSAEARKYLEEAEKSEKLALSALKARLSLPQDAPLEIGDERLVIVDVIVPDYQHFVDLARGRRPEYLQIAEGLKARQALVDAARANYYPDLFMAAMLTFAYADNRDRINNPYITDQFNHFNGGVALGARWKLDFGITGAKVAGEEAQYNRLVSTKQYADANIPLQIKKYYLELKEAEQSAKATREGYTNAKKWAVTALSNFDFGIGQAKEIFEALQVYARLRASYFQSIYNYRIARSGLDYATGEPPLDK